MAKICFSYAFGCWVVIANKMIIGRTHDRAQARQWANDYNAIH